MKQSANNMYCLILIAMVASSIQAQNNLPEFNPPQNNGMVLTENESRMAFGLPKTADEQFAADAAEIASQLDGNTIHSKTVVFVHGAFVHYSTWEHWQRYFESKGYTTLAPPWPYKEADVETLRGRQPDRNIASIRLAQVLDNYEKIIRSLPEKPILIGHSAGGLIVQVLVSRNIAAAGILIHSVPTKGVFPYEFSFLRATSGALDFFGSTKKSYLMSLRKWKYAFTNGMSLADQKESYDKCVVPESKKFARDGLKSAAKVDFKKPHVPLLFMSGSNDHIIPAHLNHRNYKRYAKRKNNSVTDYIEFKGHNHYVVGLPTWKEEADYILNWVNNH